MPLPGFGASSFDRLVPKIAVSDSHLIGCLSPFSEIYFQWAPLIERPEVGDTVAKAAQQDAELWLLQECIAGLQFCRGHKSNGQGTRRQSVGRDNGSLQAVTLF